ncbi:hypothetical protein [Saccharopolyspora sp. 5N708]|uniref:hypothetical protein n=1 Tax=Saccharopolyspora sp. 5N708 TaxID=3457424 RepID=UPI003FD44E37
MQTSDWAAMTQQYLVGELSLRLAQLQAVAGAPAAAVEAARLRREVETTLPTALTSVAVRAVRLLDEFCWDSLHRGDVAAFDGQAEVSAELYEFGVCAGLFGREGEP